MCGGGGHLSRGLQASVSFGTDNPVGDPVLQYLMIVMETAGVRVHELQATKNPAQCVSCDITVLFRFET